LPAQTLPANLCVPLFEWVIENICKNAVDAIEGKGEVTLTLFSGSEGIYIDISDTGKGIPKSKYKTVFEPGYTSKSRGWGLGLSLSKRIIENYHGGKIFVLKSEINKGTTFRIILKN
jgi:signal transduction histidine kinase